MGREVEHETAGGRSSCSPPPGTRNRRSSTTPSPGTRPCAGAGGGPFSGCPCPSPGLADRAPLWARLPATRRTGRATTASTRWPTGWPAPTCSPPGRMHDALTMAGELARQRDGRDAVPTEAGPARGLPPAVVAPPAARRPTGGGAGGHDARRHRAARRHEGAAARAARPHRQPASASSSSSGPGGPGPRVWSRCSAARRAPARRWRPACWPRTCGATCSRWTCPRSSASGWARRRRTSTGCFSDVQDAHAILFFDEAEAIFGQRGTVTNAQDRYAHAGDQLPAPAHRGARGRGHPRHQPPPEPRRRLQPPDPAGHRVPDARRRGPACGSGAWPSPRSTTT